MKTLTEPNDPLVNIEPGHVVQTHGEIYAANEARFTATFYSEPLTQYTTGWRDPNNIEATLDFIAPPVQVGRRFEYKQSLNTEAFLSEVDDVRAIGSDFKTVDYKGVTATDKTYNKGLTVRADLDIVGAIPNWREMFTARLLQRLLRNELRRAVDLLVTNATNTNKTWDISAGKDPDQDVLTDLIAGVDAAGVRANRIVYGEVAWNKRALSHRAQATAGGFASAGLSPEQVAGLFGVDGVRVSRERYQSSTTAKSKVVGDYVLMFIGMDGATPDDPTHLKRFWSAVEGGGKYRVYEQQINAKLVDLTVEHYSNIASCTTTGLRKLTIS